MKEYSSVNEPTGQGITATLIGQFPSLEASTPVVMYDTPCDNVVPFAAQSAAIPTMYGRSSSSYTFASHAHDFGADSIYDPEPRPGQDGILHKQSKKTGGFTALKCKPTSQKATQIFLKPISISSPPVTYSLYSSSKHSRSTSRPSRGSGSIQI